MTISQSLRAILLQLDLSVEENDNYVYGNMIFPCFFVSFDQHCHGSIVEDYTLYIFNIFPFGIGLYLLAPNSCINTIYVHNAPISVPIQVVPIHVAP